MDPWDVDHNLASIERQWGGFRALCEDEATFRAKAEAVLTVLTARAILVPDDARARVFGCTDTAVLDRWLTRAATAKRVEELFDDADG